MRVKKVVAKLLLLGRIKEMVIMVIFKCKFSVNNCVLINELEQHTERLNNIRADTRATVNSDIVSVGRCYGDQCCCNGCFWLLPVKKGKTTICKFNE